MGVNSVSLWDRMKRYEDSFRFYLTRRMPLIIRIDGKSFHSYTRKMDKPFDMRLARNFCNVACHLCKELDGARLAYWQSDEISLLLTDYDKLDTQAWFDKNLQKLVSVSASLTTAFFNKWEDTPDVDESLRTACFDSRAFVVPKEEVCNYFISRQRDAVRNSISSVGQKFFSPRELLHKNSKDIQEMLFTKKGLNWSKLPVWQKRGLCIKKQNKEWKIDYKTSIFSQDRKYINESVDYQE